MAGTNDDQDAEIFHVLSRQLPMVGGLRQHARPRAATAAPTSASCTRSDACSRAKAPRTTRPGSTPASRSPTRCAPTPSASTNPAIAVSAAPFYLRACHYYQMAERFRTPKDKNGARRLSHRRRLLPPIRRPAPTSRSRSSRYRSRAKACPAISFMRRTPNQHARRASYSSTASTSPRRSSTSRGVPDLIKRGISVPGHGRPRHRRGDPLPRPRTCATTTRRPAAPASISWRSALTSTAGRSASSPSASAATTRRAAPSLEPRFAACIAWGAIWDYHAVWKRRIEAQFKASLSVPGHHIMWILGVDYARGRLKRLEPFKLDGVVQKMRCPFLVVHGEDDEQIPLARCAGAVRRLRVERQDVARLHRRGRRRAALPARLSDAGVRDHVELVRRQAPSRVGDDKRSRINGWR